MEEVKGEARKADTPGVTLQKYTIVSVWLFCFLISLKMFLRGISLPPHAVVSWLVS